MKKKSFWKELKSKFVKGVRPSFVPHNGTSAGKDFGDVEDIKGKNEWIRSQFAELSRLGNRPVVMKMS